MFILSAHCGEGDALFYGMELKEFIKATIRDISDAVTELNEEMADKGLLVNPKPDNHQEGMVYSEDGRWLQKINFNVSVTVSDEMKKDGGLKVYVANAGVNSRSGSETATSLSFHITVALPTSMG